MPISKSAREAWVDDLGFVLDTRMHEGRAHSFSLQFNLSISLCLMSLSRLHTAKQVSKLCTVR